MAERVSDAAASVPVAHPAIVADADPLAVLCKLVVALLLGLTGLEALRGVLVRLGERAVVGDVLLDGLGARLLRLVLGESRQRERGGDDEERGGNLHRGVLSVGVGQACARVVAMSVR